MNLFSFSRMSVDANTWRAALELFWKVIMGSYVFYLTIFFRYLLYSFFVTLFNFVLVIYGKFIRQELMSHSISISLCGLN